MKQMAKSLLIHLSYCPMLIDANRQNSCLFTNKGHFSTPLCVLIGVLAKCLSSNWTLRIDFSHKFSLKKFDPYAHYAVCWFPLTDFVEAEVFHLDLR